jgi:hypothetical protein
MKRIEFLKKCQNHWTLLQALYKSVEDIDIFVGGILEVSYRFSKPIRGLQRDIVADQ